MAAPARASLRDLAATWFVIATQSIGGGPSTLFLMRRLLVQRRAWLTDREYLEDWVLARLSVGIAFIAMAGLIGRRIAGGRGIVVSLAALLLPSAAITLFMTIGYAAVRDERWLIAAFSGVAPVTAGMIVGIAFVFGRQSLRRGRLLAVDLCYGGVAFVAAIALNAAPLVLIVSGIVVGMTALRGGEARGAAGSVA